MSDPSLNRLANGVIWPGFGGLSVPAWLAEALQEGLAGVVYFSSNLDLDDAGQPARLSGQIHRLNPDALIGVDEEGGVVTRLEADRGSSLPGNAVLGVLDDPELTRRAHAWLGALVRSAGIDIDLAPDVDVNVNPNNPVIGVRSFGADPELVARHTTAAVSGLQSQGIAACGKHFPGHGDCSVDSHLGRAVSWVSPEELRRVHLAPFQAAIAAGVKAIMTAHIVVPAFGDQPATVNPQLLGLLRQMGFGGLIITDALEMAAIRETLGMGPGAVAALAAGADLLCIGNPGTRRAPDGSALDERSFLEVRDAIVAALQDGRLSPDRLVDAIQRRKQLVRWRHEQPMDGHPSASWDGREPARRALQWNGNVQVPGGTMLVVDARVGRNQAIGPATDPFTRALREHRRVDRIALAGLPDNQLDSRVSGACSYAGPLVVLVDEPQIAETERRVAELVSRQRPDAVIVQVGWPAPEQLGEANWVLTRGSSAVTAKALAELLTS